MAGPNPGSTISRQPTRYSPVAPTPNTLPPAPGLPARPSFELPNFNREDMLRMHTGQAPAPGNGAGAGYTQPSPVAPKKPVKESNDEMLEDLLKGIKNDMSRQASEAAVNASAETTVQTPVNQDLANQTATDASTAAKASTNPAEAAPTSKKKKSKSSVIKLVYNDDSESPEEKLAKRSKYAFKRDNVPEFVQGEVSAAVTGVTVDDDTVRDVQD